MTTSTHFRCAARAALRGTSRGGLAILVALASGGPFLWSALGSLRRGRIGADLLIGIGIFALAILVLVLAVLLALQFALLFSCIVAAAARRILGAGLGHGWTPAAKGPLWRRRGPAPVARPECAG